MNLRRRFGAYAMVLATVFAVVNVARAQDDTNARWFRAHVLFRRGDYGAALAEYLEVYKRKPLPIVRYNIGIVEARRGRPVEATEWLEACLADTDGIEASRIHDAKDVLAEQKSQVGTLHVTSNAPGATIDVDSLEAGQAPKAIRVARGVHVVSVTATGYAPMRKEVKIAGAVDERIEFKLVPSEGNIARLTVSSELPDADVVVDGVIAGKTPLLGSIKVEPKEHTIEVRRAGYRTFERKLNFPEGDIVPLLAILDEDANWIAANGGFLKLGFSEEHAMVTVDGVSLGEYQASLRLAPGMHRLHAERAGFATVERDVQVMTGQTTTTRIEFEPNPDTLVKVKEDHALRRKWGIATTVTGAALAFGGTWVAMYFYAESVRKNKPSERPHRGEVPLDQGRVVAGAAGAFLGVGAITTGIWLLNGNPDPHRYDIKPSGQKLGRAWMVPTVTPTKDGIVIGMIGSF